MEVLIIRTAYLMEEISSRESCQLWQSDEALKQWWCGKEWLKKVWMCEGSDQILPQCRLSPEATVLTVDDCFYGAWSWSAYSSYHD